MTKDKKMPCNTYVVLKLFLTKQKERNVIIPKGEVSGDKGMEFIR